MFFSLYLLCLILSLAEKIKRLHFKYLSRNLLSWMTKFVKYISYIILATSVSSFVKFSASIEWESLFFQLPEIFSLLSFKPLLTISWRLIRLQYASLQGSSSICLSSFLKGLGFFAAITHFQIPKFILVIYCHLKKQKQKQTYPQTSQLLRL